jgi:hypothetical protein
MSQDQYESFSQMPGSQSVLTSRRRLNGKMKQYPILYLPLGREASHGVENLARRFTRNNHLVGVLAPLFGLFLLHVYLPSFVSFCP